MSKAEHPNIVRVDQLDFVESRHGEKFASRSKRLGAIGGAEQIGCCLYEIDPGKTAFPYHAHSANEEAIYILSGTGLLRIGNTDTDEENHTVKAGDYIVLPASLNHPHQLINDGKETLRYLCMSTLKYPEVVNYPDSNKVGMMLLNHPASWPEMRGRGFKLLKDGDSLGYYDDE